MIDFVNLDPAEIINDVIKGVEERIGEVLYPGDERKMYIENLTPVIIALLAAINFTGNMNFSSFALNKYLDAIGYDRDVPRLPAATAETKMRFTKTVNTAVTIPAGTRVTADGKLFFITSYSLTIPAGESTGEVDAVAEQAGSIYNGLLPGQISTVVNAIPGISKVTNITETSGGTEIEMDQDYGERIRLSPEGFTNAGSYGAYEYWARTASADIEDVLVKEPSAGKVDVFVLMKGGRLPAQAELDRVYSHINADRIRPLTDMVTVKAPTIRNFDISLKYYIYQGDAARKEDIQRDARTEIENYILWQKAAIGRAINPDELRRRLLGCGVYRIDLTAPVYTDLLPSEVGVANTVTAEFEGMLG